MPSRQPFEPCPMSSEQAPLDVETAGSVARLSMLGAFSGGSEAALGARMDVLQAASDAIKDGVESYYLTVADRLGGTVGAFSIYQMNNAGHPWPYDGGKAGHDKLQMKVDELIASIQVVDSTLYIDDADRLRLLFEAFGLGVDCSKFASHLETEIFRRLGLPDYASTVFWHGKDVLVPLNRDQNPWRALDKDGAPRSLSAEERARFERDEPVAVSDLCSIFGRESGKTISAAHMCSGMATVPVRPHEVLPGDLLAWQSKKQGTTDHVGVIDERCTIDGFLQVSFWHSWDPGTGEPDGIRHDRLYFDADGRLADTSHPALVSDNYFVDQLRPSLLAERYAAAIV